MNQYETYLKLDLSKFVDEWIVIIGDKVVAHNKNAKIAYEEAVKKNPGSTPLIAKIPGKSFLIV